MAGAPDNTAALSCIQPDQAQDLCWWDVEGQGSWATSDWKPQDWWSPKGQSSEWRWRESTSDITQRLLDNTHLSSKSSRARTVQISLMQIKPYWGVSSQATFLGADLQMEMSFSLHAPIHAFTPLPWGGTGTHSITHWASSGSSSSWKLIT